MKEKNEYLYIYLINTKQTFLEIYIMGKQDRVIAQKAKDKQHTKKPKAVKTNLKRVRLSKKNLFELCRKFYLVK